MAPSSSRRSGFSKKQQYSVFTGYIVAALGALAGLVLLGLSLWQPSTFQPLRGPATDVVAPVGEAGATARSGTRSVWDTLSGYWRAGSQNAALREEVELARIKLAEAEAVKAQNASLRALLDLDTENVQPVATTRLVGLERIEQPPLRLYRKRQLGRDHDRHARPFGTRRDRTRARGRARIGPRAAADR